MRKRIVVGAFAMIVVGGLLAFALSGPKKGSIEWHKRRVIRLGEATSKSRPFWVLVARKVTGVRHLGQPDFQKLYEESSASLGQLEAMGYLVERAYLFTNGALNVETISPMARELYKGLPEERKYFHVWFTSVDPEDRLVLTVLAPPGELFKWDELVRKADVPEVGK